MRSAAFSATLTCFSTRTKLDWCASALLPKPRMTFSGGNASAGFVSSPIKSRNVLLYCTRVSRRALARPGCTLEHSAAGGSLGAPVPDAVGSGTTTSGTCGDGEGPESEAHAEAAEAHSTYHQRQLSLRRHIRQKRVPASPLFCKLCLEKKQ